MDTSFTRVSCAVLCRFRVGEHYLLLLNQNRRQKGIYELSPVGGAIEFHDKTIIDQFGLILENPDVCDLRFLIDVNKIDQFRDWFYKRQGRETDPFREIWEELVIESHILEYLDPPDLKIEYIETIEDAKPTERAGSTGMFTQYFLEIFEVRPVSHTVVKQLLTMPIQSGALLLDPTTVGQAKTLNLDIDGEMRTVKLNTDTLFSNHK